LSPIPNATSPNNSLNDLENSLTHDDSIVGLFTMLNFIVNIGVRYFLFANGHIAQMVTILFHLKLVDDANILPLLDNFLLLLLITALQIKSSKSHGKKTHTTTCGKRIGTSHKPSLPTFILTKNSNKTIIYL
jgi:hypothetical protein